MKTLLGLLLTIMITACTGAGNELSTVKCYSTTGKLIFEDVARGHIDGNYDLSYYTFKSNKNGKLVQVPVNNCIIEGE